MGKPGHWRCVGPISDQKQTEAAMGAGAVGLQALRIGRKRRDRRGPLVFRVAVPSFCTYTQRSHETKEHPGTEITAVWDEDRERGAVEASARCPFPRRSQFLSREDVDGGRHNADVAHREVIPAAARAGKHVFAEKVIAPTLGEARRWWHRSRRPG